MGLHQLVRKAEDIVPKINTYHAFFDMVSTYDVNRGSSFQVQLPFVIAGVLANADQSDER